jgi:ribosome-associated protein
MASTSKTKASKKPSRPTRKRPAAPRLRPEVKLAIAAAQDKKAVDIVVLDLRKASAFTDCFLIFTGTNTRQVKAIADGIEEALRAVGLKPAILEGYERAEWVLIDYFDFIVHVFTPATRDFYALENLWGDAVRFAVPAN